MASTRGIATSQVEPAAERPTKPVLITIHGIRTEGVWQTAVEPLFAPFYQHRPFKYKEYAHPLWSVVWLAMEPLALIAGFVLAVVAAQFYLSLRLSRAHALAWWDWVILLVVAVTIWLAARWVAGARRRAVAERFYQHWEKTTGAGLPPHVIAHSLGSYFVGSLFHKFEALHASRVILTGCVLAKTFPWEQMAKAKRFEQIRNEMALKDWVPKFARLLGPFVHPMGNAGVRGFHCKGNVCQTWADPHEVDSGCANGCTCKPEAAPSGARVHNIPHPQLGHSDYFIAASHAREFWLPGLWGFPSRPYVEFRTLCIRCRDDEASKQYGRLARQEEQLRENCWGWTRGKLIDRARNELAEHLKRRPASNLDREQVLSVAIRNLWQLVAAATEHPEDPNLGVCLDPNRALSKAIDGTLNVMGA